jgi:hypothetical protein
MNLGLGLGGVVGGLIASTADPGSFTRTFLLDAATFFAFVAVLSAVAEPLGGEPEHRLDSRARRRRRAAGLAPARRPAVGGGGLRPRGRRLPAARAKSAAAGSAHTEAGARRGDAGQPPLDLAPERL